jgi:hypothetical protein
MIGQEDGFLGYINPESVSINNTGGNMTVFTATKEDIGDKWPLKPEKVRILVSREKAIFVIHKNKRYALNGTARALNGRDLEPIWLDNPDVPGAKMSLGPLFGLVESKS